MARKDEFGGTWWAKRWTSALERLGWSSRLQRGRTYARQGNVLEVKVRPGRIDARVQGSRRRPYRVTIDIQPLSDSDWDRAASAMAEHASFAARLLAGEMPENIEDVFVQCDTQLFPHSERDIDMSCTCPDWANPCKHIAAVFYTLGTEFDRDPFLLLLLRGMSREHLLAALREKRAQAAAAGRDPAKVLVYTLVTVIVDETDDKARAKFEDYKRHVSYDGALVLMSGWSGIDFGQFALRADMQPFGARPLGRQR